MDKEIKRKLFTEILSRPVFSRRDIASEVESLLAVDDMKTEDVLNKNEAFKRAELEALQAKVAEAESILAEANPKITELISSLKVVPVKEYE